MRSVEGAGPDRGPVDHGEPVSPPRVLQPARERHPVVGELREVGGRGLARELDVDDPETEPPVCGTGPDEATGWGDDPSVAVRGRREHLEDVGP